MKRGNRLWACAFAGAALLLFLFWMDRRAGEDGGIPPPSEPIARRAPTHAPGAGSHRSRPSAAVEADSQMAPDPVSRLVEEFDAHVDAWQEPRPNGATLQDAEDLRARLMKLPAHLRAEEMDRALVLIPDENAFIFAAVLFDKTQPPQLLDAILCDVLNREEGVKDVLLRKIHEDKSHPCWEDVDWLLSATDDETDSGMQ